MRAGVALIFRFAKYGRKASSANPSTPSGVRKVIPSTSSGDMRMMSHLSASIP